jgi:ATP-dependent helicase/nuclease subunit B
MATIARQVLETDASEPDRWGGIAARIAVWADAQGISLRDAVVLLPFAQLLPEARRAFARAGGWMPRIETTHTLAVSLGPPTPIDDQQIAFDKTIDSLNARALLRSQAFGADIARRDARSFEQAAAALVTTAHELARATFALPPAERAAHWTKARELLVPGSGPGGLERRLARTAFEWACLAAPPITDHLFAMAPPAAWISVQAGGPDLLVERLMADAPTPCLVIDTDESEDDPFSRIARHAPPAFAVCDSFEQEAQCAAAQVLAHVQRQETPVALIAQDAVLVRRVHALLGRADVAIADERGWKLSTTRAAAQIMALLNAARGDAGTDDLLDWLKAGTANADDVSALEVECRRRQIARVAALDAAALEPAAARLWAAASNVLAGLSASRRQPLPAWLAALASALAASGDMTSLQRDDAGSQVVRALRLDAGSTVATWLRVASATVMNFDEFRAWVDGELEDATFRPSTELVERPDVVITPLAAAMLRPFAAIVFPGADDKRLGASPSSVALLSDAQAASFGVPTVAQRRHEELLGFTQILSMPRVTLLRRRVDGTDPLADSPLVERLALALAANGGTLARWNDPRTPKAITATPIHMTAPAAASLLPASLSASAAEALRACPYRFFALNMLKLREDDELEREVEKRDFGNWLHQVLFEFHQARSEPAPAEAEVAALMTFARSSQTRQGLSDADFLPFSASFESFAPRYVAWLHERDADGAHWLKGEEDIVTRPEVLGGTELHGVIDRIDEWRHSTGSTLELIDYKTGSAASLRDKVKQPLEDTQLAFYAALMRTRSELPIKAAYLALDGTKGIEEVEHPGVEDSAAALVDGLAHDLRRLRAGAGLPALGEGSTCAHCAARGICRRDHWTPEAEAAP